MRFLVLLCSFIVSAVTAVAHNGQMLSFELCNSKVYPGTERTIKVYVPNQYDGITPAALILGTDKQEDVIAKAIDALVAEGSMPVAIAVVVRPGRIYNDKREVIRYNRSNEYDRVDGRFAHFVESEVLPAVERLVCDDGRKIVITTNPDMRAITGNSSGGICAFNAAWQRPDLFRRVYASCGTFIPFRGGDQFPALVRKGETRPLKVFLQDNDKDTWNPLFGSWFEYNNLMLSALQFAGYDVRFQWDKGGHSGKNARLIFTDVMRWLWTDWQSGIKAGTNGNKALADIVLEEQPWRCVAEGIAEGAMLHPYSEQQVLLATGKQREAVTVDGTRTKLKSRTALSNPYRATYPGGAHCAIVEQGSNYILNAVVGAKGELLHTQQFYYLYTDAGQILFDSKGYLYAATAVGIQICDHNGRVRAILAAPMAQKVTSIAFAGNNLFAIVGDKLYVRLLRRSGTHNGVPKSEGQG